MSSPRVGGQGEPLTWDTSGAAARSGGSQGCFYIVFIGGDMQPDAERASYRSYRAGGYLW